MPSHGHARVGVPHAVWSAGGAWHVPLAPHALVVGHVQKVPLEQSSSVEHGAAEAPGGLVEEHAAAAATPRRETKARAR